MIESAPQLKSSPEEEQQLLLELRDHAYITLAEASPYRELVDEYITDPALEETLKKELGEQWYRYFEEVVAGIKFYLSGPKVKDTFGNYHELPSSEHGGLSRRDLYRELEQKNPSFRALLDRNRYKLAVHLNSIHVRIQMIEQFVTPETAPTFTQLFATLPRELHQKLSETEEKEEISEGEKDEWVQAMDDFAVTFLRETQVQD